MRRLAESDSRTVYAAEPIARSTAAWPCPPTPFVCLIWDHDGRCTEPERDRLIDQLLDAECRYLVCGGERCEEWHDTADEAFVIRNLDDLDDALDHRMLMTTWHEGEDRDEVVFFFLYTTAIDECIPKRFLVVHVGEGDRVGLERSVKAVFLGENS